MKARMTVFKTRDIEKCKIIGKELRCCVVEGEENPIPCFWDQCFNDGTIDRMEKLPGRIEPEVLLGWCGDFNPADKNFSYIIGVLAEPETKVPDEFTSIEIPASRFAVATIEGNEPDIFMMAHDLTFREMEKAGIEYDPDRGFEMEWYDDRFCKDEKTSVIDLYVPIR